MEPSFKRHIGFVVIYAALAYGVGISLMLLFFGRHVVTDDKVWAFLSNVISTVLGWVLSKASTIIDYQYGSSVSGGDKPLEAPRMTPAAPCKQDEPPGTTSGGAQDD